MGTFQTQNLKNDPLDPSDLSNPGSDRGSDLRQSQSDLWQSKMICGKAK